MAFKNDKLKTKYKNSALCLSEKLVSFYTLRFIHNTVGKHFPKTAKSMTTNEYCNLHIPRCASHLEHLREVIDISDGIEEIAEKVDGNKRLTEFFRVLNFNSLVTITDLESTIILKNLTNSVFEIERKYHIKLANLTIYEFFNTYDKYRKEIKDISTRTEELTESFKKINLKIRDFRKENDFDKKINEVRNKTIGHIEKDYKLYYKIVSEIDIQKSLKMLGSFIMLVNDIMEFSSDCMTQTDGTDISGIDIDETYEKLKNKIEEFRKSGK
ncbi:hypothetical protein OOZ35_07670 [Mesoflavibacter profundi]|uniref:Cthe-2314-like HEPN domain-containing protein n=1 Tax=Mesoflavibacter profundi TaxID=2708110 RepID=A0ABT4RZV4_9FLAO|nr:hypothetical protein [Mesoflavibacter profundi]MDA0177363.1 hypothetical protein [Mesoflavibacter profundi]